MAILATIEHNYRTYENAYIKVSISNVDKFVINIICEVWESVESRNIYPTPLFTNSYTLNLSDIASNNPLDYAYKLLESNAILTNAIFNTY